jgi:hypothetical protein
MKKDIPELKVEDVAIAIVPRQEDKESEVLWDSYIVNFKEEPISSVLVNSKGYGKLEGGKSKNDRASPLFRRNCSPELCPDRADPDQTVWIDQRILGQLYA